MSFEPTGFSKEIFEQRYAIPGETWSDFCLRVASNIASAERDQKKKYYTDEFYQMILDNKFIPGGRICYGAGRHNQMLNCLSYETEIITKQGIRKIGEVENTIQKVLTSGKSVGRWVDAHIRCFGIQPLKKITIRRYKREKVIYATSNHRWFIRFRKQTNKKSVHRFIECTTDELKPKMKLQSIYAHGIKQVTPSPFGIAHGITFGDGSCSGSANLLFLCGDKDKELLRWFPNSHSVSLPNVCKDGAISISHLPNFFKEFPNITETRSYLYGWLAGYFAADGCCDQFGLCVLTSTKKENLLFAYDVCSILGIGVLDIRKQERISNLTGKPSTLYILPLLRETLDENFFLLTKHRERFLNHPIPKQKEMWKVVSVEETTRIEPVYCAIVPEFHAFALAGNILTGNCFVGNSNMDSKEGWAKTAYDMIKITMSGGGLGLDFSDIRPDGSPIGNNGGTCPGPVSLMELINGVGEPVRSGGGRRSALLFSLDLDHPDIEKFLNHKLERGKLELANVSVRCKNTTEFIKAIQNDGDWELKYKGKSYRKIKAKSLWNLIVKNSYECGEPGFLNWELVERENNLAYCAPVVSCNPCGEQCLGEYSSCCLGHIVLPRFVDDKGNVDWHNLGNVIRSGIRFLDNVLTINKYPLEEIKDKSDRERRIGLGTTGLSDYLILRGLKYGSPKALEEIDRLYRFISKVAYEASVMLAIEKGPFPWFDVSKFLESGYMRKQTKKVRALIKEHGIRNCALLTVAPTGTVSIISGNCSSGLEPIFAPAYERRFWENKKRKTESVIHPLFKKFYKEGKSLDHFVSSKELSVRQHLEVQATVQRHIDSAISKTVFIPADYPMEDMSKVWLEFLPSIKGTTFYRESTRGYYNKDTGETEEPPLKALSLEEAKKLIENENVTVGVKEVSNCTKGNCEI